ncbi:GH25 family lysozyme [Rothia mucilaginosa]|uniref:GH25 family lysozyme n=1 Tax=Rothia mucilaginosa TaxID=43675 RepID=UPI00066B9597|nr:GH25 family lysozyme [Rothia mucilaginosa]
MKKLQTAARSAAARSIMASAGALSLVAASLTSVPAAFAAPSASVAAEVNPNASYEELTYAPAPDASLVERSNPAMGAGERERLGTANARTGATSPASTATLSGISATQSSAQGLGAGRAPAAGQALAPGQALAQGRSAWTPSGGTLGMDVSSHQQNVDWASAYAAGSRFAYVKATEGTYYTNPYFGQQYNGSAQVGMVRGAYHFANPRTSSGADQARYFVQNGGAWTADGQTLPGLLDIEFNPYPAYGNTCFNMTPAQLTAWTRDFVDTYRSLTGRAPMVYTATSWWSQCVGSQQFGALPLHLASYSTVVGAIPAGWSGYDIWQFTDSGPFVGDSNFFPGTVNDLKVLAKNPKAVHRNWSNGQDRAVEERAAEDRAAQDSNVVTTATGSIDIRTGIGNFWNKNRSFYGNPIGTEYSLGHGVYAQKFTNGKTIYWTNSHGSHWLVTNGGLDQKFRSDIARFRGLTTDEETRSDAMAVSFANGEGAYWSNAYGTHIINEHGSIYATWRAAGMRGVPTTDEQNLGNGLIKQEFTGSTTYVWSAQTGTHRMHTGGAFYHRFLQHRGIWGAPVTDETTTSTGAQIQFASGKVLLWSDAYGAYETNGNGAIFKHWEKNTARYGAARGDESYVNGVYYMDFERGTIRWTAQRGIY